MNSFFKRPVSFGVFFFFIVVVAVENGRALAGEVDGDAGGKSAPRQARNAVPPSGLPPTRFTPDEIHQVVAVHNNLRSSVTPGAANMQYMKWHDELAAMSQAWADKCEFEHGQVDVESPPYGQIGQNLWKGSPRMSRSPQPIQDWYGEVVDYHFDTLHCNEGRECGHYTQVVWAETNRVGCGVMECDGFTIIVCNYGPIGNHQGVPPYKVGTACTKCASGAGWCDHGLCVDCQDGDCECPLVCQNCGELDTDTCTCSCKDGWDGLDCADLCNNTYAGCYENPGYPQAACSRLSMLQTGCREMCGYCAFASEDSGNTCCGGKICHNGGVLDTVNDCTCTCMNGFHGENCQHEDVVEESMSETTGPRSTAVPMGTSLVLFVLISLMKIVAL
ncbi:cysteine-rich venom protein-like [Branchiostoma floridae]|uniref:Cysteine-rich venom protein-like n=1 Tax=Branchiostoma floridae TaxID=7739 RepID=A0A9J7MUG1_BRAFL|nr:cysteine-rich venom protein-like [Branchiostoma floridae]